MCAARPSISPGRERERRSDAGGGWPGNLSIAATSSSLPHGTIDVTVPMVQGRPNQNLSILTQPTQTCVLTTGVPHARTSSVTGHSIHLCVCGQSVGQSVGIDRTRFFTSQTVLRPRNLCLSCSAVGCVACDTCTVSTEVFDTHRGCDWCENVSTWSSKCLHLCVQLIVLSTQGFSSW